MASRKQSKVRVKEKAQLKEIPKSGELDLIIYWTTLLVLVIVNFFAAIVMVPFMFFVPGMHFFLLLALLAVFFGYVFNLLLTRIENLDIHHHIIAVFFIPAFALINLILISNSITGFAALLGVESYKDPIIISVVYIVFFIFPYLIHVMKEKI